MTGSCIPYRLTKRVQVSTVELVQTHDDMTMPVANKASRCSCNMARLGRDSMRHSDGSVPVIPNRQLKQVYTCIVNGLNL